jgi:hypothetical protein
MPEHATMKFFSIYIPDASNAGPPQGARKQALDDFIANSTGSGQLLMGGGFLSLKSHGAVLRRSGGVTRVIDGPYTESKELLGGFALLEFASREAAIEGTRQFLEIVGDGECLTSQITDGPPQESCD